MHNKQNNKESKTYVQGLRPFGNTLPRGVRGILKKNGYCFFHRREIVLKNMFEKIGKDFPYAIREILTKIIMKKLRWSNKYEKLSNIFWISLAKYHPRLVEKYYGRSQNRPLRLGP